jgi:hypothetical protein
MEYMHDFLQRCIKQVAGRLNDNGSSFDHIVDHMLEICQYFFQKHTISYMAPQVLDYRLFMMLSNMIYAEMFRLVSPQDINIDFSLLFNVRNFSVYASIIAPCGRIAEGYREMESYHFGRRLT